jgi:16S rRNA pseudouridine516 synthase
MYDYIMFHKPSGCITARRDERHKTIMDYLPEEIRDTHFPVGRLDKDTEGLLLITNDGRLTRKLLMPEHKVEKTYYFMAEGVLDEKRLDEVRRGARIYYNRENPTAPSEVDILSTSTLGEITTPLSDEDKMLKLKKPHLPTVEGIVKITEGKKHQVKRMVRYAGARVIYLKRLSMATLTLDESLERGSHRPLTESELSTLCESIGYKPFN